MREREREREREAVNGKFRVKYAIQVRSERDRKRPACFISHSVYLDIV